MRRFLAVGIFSTAIDYLIYACFIYFHFTSPNNAIIVGYLSGFIFSFIVTRRYVFSQRRINAIHAELGMVFFIAAVGLGLNILIVQSLQTTGMNLYSARVMAIAVVFFFNFFARKVFVYE